MMVLQIEVPMKDKDYVVTVDVRGFNFYVSTIGEVAEKYNLNIFQLSHLRNTGELQLFNGAVTITYP
nr:hypothetical protein K32PH164C1_LOCUS79 [Klebsiella phage vB_Kpl_K32PH164C1]